MHKWIAALRAAKPTQLPQLGLRLVNGLSGAKPPLEFWQEYVEWVGEPSMFARLSPHSKCLLTCVASKLPRDAVRLYKAGKLVQRIFSDTLVPRVLSVLNLELINMLLVASYVMKVPITNQQLHNLLERASELIRHNNFFNLEFTVSVLHSLGAIARSYPPLRQQVASSELVGSIVDHFPEFCQKLNPRELSLVIYSFDKLKVMDDALSETVVSNVKDRCQEIQSQDLATILFACSSNKGTAQVLEILRDNVERGRNDYNGREACNICCAYLKALRWDDSLFTLLVHSLPKMNAQELCNVVNLMMHNGYKQSKLFCKGYVEHINKRIGQLKLSLLDVLTIVQSLSTWDLASEICMKNLDAAIKKAIEGDRSAISPKHVYLLHYCVLIGCKKAANASMARISEHLDKLELSNKELVVLYNASCNMGVNRNILLRLEGIVKQRIAEGQRFSEIDMLTLARWVDPEMKLIMARALLSKDVALSPGKMKHLSFIMKDVQDEQILDIAKQMIEAVLVSNREGQSYALSADLNGDHLSRCHDIGTIVAASELLPLMKGRMDVIAIFERAIALVLEGMRFGDLDVKLLVSLLAVARKLNAKVDGIKTIANDVSKRLAEVKSHSAFLEYLNAIYHLELDIDNVDNILQGAKKVMSMESDTRTAEATFLTLSAMCFFGSIHPGALSRLFREEIIMPVVGSNLLARKALYVYFASVGSVPSSLATILATHVEPTIERNLAQGTELEPSTWYAQSGATKVNHIERSEEHNQIQSSVYATLRRLQREKNGSMRVFVEVPVAFDYVADILLSCSPPNENSKR